MLPPLISRLIVLGARFNFRAIQRIFFFFDNQRLIFSRSHADKRLYLPRSFLFKTPPCGYYIPQVLR
jgi:hypothetical protein